MPLGRRPAPPEPSHHLPPEPARSPTPPPCYPPAPYVQRPPVFCGIGPRGRFLHDRPPRPGPQGLADSLPAPGICTHQPPLPPPCPPTPGHFLHRSHGAAAENTAD